MSTETNSRPSNSAPAPGGGKNGVGAAPAGPLSRAMLANNLAHFDAAAAQGLGVEPGVTATPPRREPDETTVTEGGEHLAGSRGEATAGNDAGTEQHQDEETQAAEAGEHAGTEGHEQTTEGDPNGGGEPAAELQSTGDAALDEALAGLNADGRKTLLEAAAAIQSGETTLGEVKRRMKLGRAENEELTRLRAENEQLRAGAASAPAAPANLPPNIAKLKSVQEVQAYNDQLTEGIRAIEDALEDNQGDVQVGDQTFTRRQLIERKRAMQDEAKLLPQAAANLNRSTQIAQQRTAMKAQTVKDFPWLADAENADTKAVAQLLKNPAFAAFPNADYLAAAMAVGHRTMQAELTRRRAGKGTPAGQPAGAKPVQTNGQRPAGTVPARKPHVAAAAGGRPGTVVNGRELAKSVKDRASFAEAIAAGGF